MTTKIVSVSSTQSKMQVNDLDSFTFDSAGNLGVASLNGGQLGGFRNRIINGGMRIDQRNSGAAVTPGSGATYTLDRFYLFATQASKLTVQQTTAPSGFIGSPVAAKITVASAYTSLAADVFAFDQAIEGFNIVDLAWGTANAKSIIVSFWAQCSVTGTYSFALLDKAAASSCAKSFSLTANVAKLVTLAFPGPTSGTFGTGSDVGFYVILDLGSGTSSNQADGVWTAANKTTVTGQTSFVANAGATFQYSALQFEIADPVNPKATPFEQRPYGMELALCQRYYQQMLVGAMGAAVATNQVYLAQTFPVQMRVSPSVSTPTGTLSINDSVGSFTQSAPSASLASVSASGLIVTAGNFVGLTVSRVAFLVGSAGTIPISAEL